MSELHNRMRELLDRKEKHLKEFQQYIEGCAKYGHVFFENECNECKLLDAEIKKVAELLLKT